MLTYGPGPGKEWNAHQHVTTLRSLRGDFLIVSPDARPRSDGRIPGGRSWDFDLAAQHLEMYGGVIRLNDVLFVADNFNLAGGFDKGKDAIRNAGEGKATEYLPRKWPKFLVKVVKKDKPKKSPSHHIRVASFYGNIAIYGYGIRKRFLGLPVKPIGLKLIQEQLGHAAVLSRSKSAMEALTYVEALPSPPD